MNRYTDHDSFLIQIAPYGMRDITLHEIGFILVNENLFVFSEYHRLTLHNDKQVIVFMRMLFKRSSAFQGNIGYGTVYNTPHGTE